MEPITALLSIAAVHGVKAAVRALGGDNEVADLSGDLFRALAASESHLDERLSVIEAKLDEVVEQRYRVALGTGVRYFLDAGAARGSRTDDLDRARAAFIEATTAARSSLQQAIAERYLLLTLIAQTHNDLILSSFGRLESAATAAAFDTVRHTADRSGLSSSSSRARRFGRGQPVPGIPTEVQRTALETLSMCARLLAEASALGPAFALQSRTAPPVEAKVPQGGVFGAFWSFGMRLGDVLRIGCVTIRIVPQGAAVSKELREARERIAVAHVRLEPPLPRRVRITVSPGSSTGTLMRWNGSTMQAGEAEIVLEARPGMRPGTTMRPRLTLQPEESFISLIEIVVETTGFPEYRYVGPPPVRMPAFDLPESDENR